MRRRSRASRLDVNKPVPLHVQLTTLLLDDILHGHYGTEGRLPTEHELCAEHGISRTPVHRALSTLADDGVILRHRKRGSFVNPHWLQHNRTTSELRVMVPEGSWDGLIRRATPEHASLRLVQVGLPDLHRTLTHAVAEGHAPDVALLDSVWVPEFAAAGFLHPLDELDPHWVSSEYEGDFLEPFVTAHRHEGHPVAVQAEVDLAGLWYRRRDLDDAGVRAPSTWKELAAAARAVGTSPRRAPIALPGGSRAGETATYCLVALLASNAAAILGADGVVTIDSTNTRQALRFLRGLAAAGLVPADAVTYEWDMAIRLLGQGRASMALGGSYETTALASAAGIDAAAVWDEFGFTRMPAGPRGRSTTLAGGMTYGIFRQAADPQLALRLVENLVGPDALVHMARKTGQIPSRRSAADLAAGHSAFLETTTSMLDDIVVRPATRDYARLSAQLQTLLEAVIAGDGAPTAACRRAAEAIGAITGRPIVAAR